MGENQTLRTKSSIPIHSYAIAERLFDLDSDETSEMEQSRASTSDENENYRPNSPKGGDSDSSEDEEEEYKSSQQRGRAPWRRSYKQISQSQTHDPPSCFICKGAHQVSECPQKAALCAFQAKLRANSKAEYETIETKTSLDRTVGYPRVGALSICPLIRREWKR